tara:strand:+ start:243 stop:1565 length:1323 start_codon:yes stop_codon:yes gene_type:complete
MIEIIGILIQLIIFLVIFSFPFTPKLLNNSFGLKNNTLNYIDAHAVNIIFFILLATIFSFTNFDLKILFKLHIITGLIFLIINIKKIKLNIDKSKLFNFLIFSIVVISVFFVLALNLKLEWDGHHWIEKTVIFFNGLSIQELKNVRIHPMYPHTGSYIWAYFWKNSLLELEYVGRYFQVYFYILSIFLCVNLLKTKDDISKILFILFLLLITFEPYLLAGYQEYLIFSSLIVASRFIALLNFNNQKDYKLILLVISILYTLCWFKDEGIIYYIVFSVLLILFLNYSLKKKLLLLIFITSLLVLQYYLQKYLIGIYDFPQVTPINDVFKDIMNIDILLTKTYKIILHTLISFIKYPMWLIVLVSFLIIILISKKIDKIFTYYSCCLILNMGFIFAIFFSFKTFDLMLKVSLDRLLFQTSGFYIIFLFIFLNKMKQINKINF